MFLAAKPDVESIRRFLENQRDSGFSYSEVGASSDGGPDSYNHDHNRCLLGHGQEIYTAACNAIREWKMFDFPWVELHLASTPIQVGANVAVVINHFGFWSINAARIVYLVNQAGDVERLGFAYGTLHDHGEIGEERFSVEFHRSTGEVWYDLFAFSRPNHWVAVLGYPLSRYLQKRFARDSKIAMQMAVNSYK